MLNHLYPGNLMKYLLFIHNLHVYFIHELETDIWSDILLIKFKNCWLVRKWVLSHFKISILFLQMMAWLSKIDNPKGKPT